MKGLERLILQGMHIADRIAAIFLILQSSLIKDSIIILKAVVVPIIQGQCECWLSFVRVFYLVLNATLNNCDNNLPFSRLHDFSYRSVSNFPWIGQYRGKIIGYL